MAGEAQAVMFDPDRWKIPPEVAPGKNRVCGMHGFILVRDDIDAADVCSRMPCDVPGCVSVASVRLRRKERA